MKPKGKLKKGGKKDTGKLLKYMELVEEFVQNKSGGCDNTEDFRGVRSVKKKSRKELRKEKRKLKKTNIKNHYEGYKQLKSDNGDITTPSNKPQLKKKVTEKATKESPAQKPKPQVEDTVKKQDPAKTKPQRNPASKKGKKKNKLQESRKKALLEANVVEDREIKKLERFLGFNKRKNKKTLPQSFTADGLDYILGVLDAGSSATGIYDSDDDMDKAKDNFEKLNGSDSEMSGEEEDQGGDSDSENSEQESDEDLDIIDEEAEDEQEDGLEEEEEEEDDKMEVEDDGMHENSGSDAEEEREEEGESGSEVKAPGPKDENTACLVGKYVPPHLRDSGDEKRKIELQRLKRNVKGLVNRLSEANMASICSQLEALYMSSSRKDMNDTLTEVLLAACASPALLPDRLIMEHVLLVSVLHHTVGLEIGAHFLETVVRKFDEMYKTPSEGKESANLVAIVAHLYNFQVVHAMLIFDVLKLLGESFTEKDIELMLFVLRNVGFSLRKDDAMALKELITEAQRKASDVGTKFQDQTRVRFMLETMLALKNNNMRKIPGYDPEPVERLRKLQKTLIHQSVGGTDVKLRVSLENLLAADQVGRWWIVGSCWTGAPMIGARDSQDPKQPTAEGKFSAKVLDQARKQRMNTDIRRNIFCVVLTSEDYMDAFEKLLRMGLKGQQEREIVHVLMDCCLQEKTFNAFYVVLGEKFCTHDRRFQMTFQFSLWDKFKDLDSLPSSTFSNLVQLVTHFLQKKCLSLSILKVIEFGELDKPKVRFLRQVMTKLLKETEPEVLESIFGRISGIPKLGMLREGLKLFISHFLLKKAPSESPAEQAALLTERARVATKAMEAREAKLKL
ncbi:nucleolar MIF4G domain-containing protein 1 [Hypomesus transpacificus]|uniref:nucleolar MIF4G domain-containing protein 1 n=1 Tax=Hypomesus transpacificus TaxID=137520 RepID=UPI001F07E025|nr:nucleolar MIF4G domain-containing protein 1 [Hypomesus transpacificus]